MSNAPRKVDYRKTQPQNYTDAIGGEHLAIYKGKCVVCGRNVYNAKDIENGEVSEWDYNPDPRGTIDPYHSCDTLIAEEYSKVGADVELCFDCSNDAPLYRKGLAIAYAQWKDIPELETEAQ